MSEKSAVYALEKRLSRDRDMPDYLRYAALRELACELESELERLKDLARKWDDDKSYAALYAEAKRDLTAAREALEAKGRECVLAKAVVSAVRNYPDFDHGGPFPQMMDEFLEGKPPSMLIDIAQLRAGVKPTTPHEYRWVKIDAYDALEQRAATAEAALAGAREELNNFNQKENVMSVGATTEAIARVCYEVNRAYCEALGDTSQLPWEQAPEWQRESAKNGVEFHACNPKAGPDHSHVEWLKEKERTGWKYGPVKDEAKKEHPCFVPYDELPTEQKAKDYIFRAVVHALR